MQFRVPQFIEVEAKVVGPFSFRQFVFLAGGIGFMVMLWFWVSPFVAIVLGAPFAAFGVALAYWRPYGMPFEKVLEAAFWYFTSRHLYLWQKPKAKAQTTKGVATSLPTQRPIPTLRTTGPSKLRELAFQLDVQQRARPKRENADAPKQRIGLQV